MASDTSLGTPDTCESRAHPVSPQREAVLSQDAQHFNQVLKDNETDGTGKGNMQVAAAATKAFYEELIQVPVGERRELLRLAEAGNTAAQAGDPAMPTIDKTIDSNGFLEKLIVDYKEPVDSDTRAAHRQHAAPKATQFDTVQLVYGGDGMCAEYDPQSLR